MEIIKIVQDGIELDVNGGYAELTGATFTGNISSPIVAATKYFVTPTLVGEGDDSKYFHRVVFGHRNFDKMEFHEYGGLFNFFQNQKGGANDGQLLFQISPSDVNSNVDLKERGVRVYSPNNKPTAADLGITTGTNGATFTPAVDDAGNLSWSNDKDLANPNPVNIKGDKGDKGDTGPKGDQGPPGDPATNIIKSVNGKTGAVTISKSDVELNNVDNIKQMPISGGVLENYREKLTTVSASGGSINLSLGNVFVHTPGGNITYSITNAVNGQAHSFTLIINMGSTVRTLTFPASVKWQGGETPDLSTASKTYVLTFMSVNGGNTWLGMFGGMF